MGIFQTSVRQVKKLPPNQEKYSRFCKIAMYIPKSFRQNFIPEPLKQMINKYKELFIKDPFNEEPLACGTALVTAMSEARQKRWTETLQRMGMSNGSKMAWNLVKKLNHSHQ